MADIMGNKVVKIVECSNWDMTYGYVVTDEDNDVQAEIYRIKNDPKFLEEYGECEWTIEDVFENFSFDFEWISFSYDDVAEI